MRVSTSSLQKKLIILFLVIGGIYYGRHLLIPLAIAGLIAMLLLPFSERMESRKVPKFVAVLICVLTAVAGVGLVVTLLSWQVSELFQDYSLVKERGLEVMDRLQQIIFDQFGIDHEKQARIFENEEYSLTDILIRIVGSVSSILANTVLVLAYVFLILYYRSHLRTFLLKLSPAPQRSEMDHVINGVARVSQQYLLGLCKMIVCLWIMYGIGFSILGVRNPIFFAVLCGLCEIVPFIGNITGTSLTLLVSAIHGGSVGLLVGILLTYGIIQFVQGWILEPLIVGPQVKINPFATIVALVVGEMLWGLPGIFLAIPLVAMIKIVCDHIDSLKPFGYLIGVAGQKKV